MSSRSDIWPDGWKRAIWWFESVKDFFFMQQAYVIIMSQRFPRISLFRKLNQTYKRLSVPVIIYPLGLSSLALVSIECRSFPWLLDQGRIDKFWGGWRWSGFIVPSRVHWESLFGRFGLNTPKSWILFLIWRSILPAFSHTNAMNMQKSQSACYTYRRQWDASPHPLWAPAVSALN